MLRLERREFIDKRAFSYDKIQDGRGGKDTWSWFSWAAGMAS